MTASASLIGNYRLKQDRDFRCGSCRFTMASGSSISVVQENSSQVLLSFGDRMFEWYHKSVLDELEPLSKGPAEYDYQGDEIAELLDLVMADGSIHDLDQHKPEDMQTTSGSTFAWILHRCQRAEAALKALYESNNRKQYDAMGFGRALEEAERVLADITKNKAE